MTVKRFDRGLFLVNALAIIYRNGKVLIGKRKGIDPYIKKLTWTFPGGRLYHTKSLEDSLKTEVKKKTNLDVEIKKLIFARVWPERKEFLLLYNYCEPTGGKEKAGEKFTEIKWVKPTEVTKYFTTSVDSEIMEFLRQLEKNLLNLR
jgi:ADP-ribose pyrophosphatase YjhB (NUDIX family)